MKSKKQIFMIAITSSLLAPWELPNSHEIHGSDFVFGTPITLDTVNSNKRERYPAISPNGLELYFTSDRDGGIENPDDSGQTDIWVARRSSTGDPFAAPELAPGAELLFPTPINSLNWEQSPDLAADGLTLYFASNPGDTPNKRDEIYYVTRPTLNSPWQWETLLNDEVNSAAWGEVSPNISSDGLELYFVRQKPPYNVISDYDIYRSIRDSTAAPWGEAEKLLFNSDTAYDGNPSLSADDLTLFFTSFRAGGLGNGDIWTTTRSSKNDDWGIPANLGAPVNSSAFDGWADISADDQTLYFARGSNWRDGNTDLWQASRINVALAGDYNDDGRIDAADFTVWRDNFGAPAGTLPNDATGLPIGQSQYDVWAVNFGQSAVAGEFSTPAVPEPSSLLFVLSLIVGFSRCRAILFECVE